MASTAPGTTSNELLTAKTFTRTRALAMLEEFSPARIQSWLVDSCSVPPVDAGAAAEQVTARDTLGLAIARFRILARPLGDARRWAPEDREFYERPIWAFAFKVHQEMVTAGFIGRRQAPAEAFRVATRMFMDWCKVFSAGPVDGAPLTREEVLRMVWGELVLPAVDGLDNSVKKAARALSAWAYESVTVDNFAAEFRACLHLQDGVRGPTRYADGWRFSASAMAGYVMDGRPRPLSSEHALNAVSLDTPGTSGAPLSDSVAAAQVGEDVDLVVSVAGVRDMIDRGRARGLAVEAALDYRHPDNRNSREAVAARHGCTVEAIRHANAWLDAEAEILKKSRAG